MQVSIRELKNNLSKYIHIVTGGTNIVITSHHTPLAKIVAIHAIKTSKLQTLPQIEGVHWSGKKPQGGGKNRPKISGKTMAEYVLEDRG